MNKKQKKMLARIIIAGLLLVLLAIAEPLIPLTGYTKMILLP